MSTAITAGLVSDLRKRSGAGMMECKKALVEVDGDIEKAFDVLRKSGQAKADKKSGRVAAEGIIICKRSADGKQAVMVEINSETDFVARDTNFLEFAEKIGEIALNAKLTEVPEFMKLVCKETGRTIEQVRTELVAKIGENITVRRITLAEADTVVGTYVHSSRIGVMVKLKGGDENLARDIAMHIAATSPVVVQPADVPEELINKEKEIFSAQAAASGKPAEIIEKMISGRIKKYLDEISLVGQPFVKDPSKNVGQLLKDAKAEVTGFIRYMVGEGIEKQEANFAEEVMAQVKG